jgi:hypothetical protein
VLQRLHTKAKRLLQEEAEELLARTLARSLAPSFVVVWLCLFCGCCMYTPAPKSVIAACTPAAPLSPLAALPLFYQTVEPSTSSFKLWWWYQINVTLADGRTN